MVRTMGKKRYANPKGLMVTADGGGSNGYRVRLWKVELQKLANEIKLRSRSAILPPGTSRRVGRRDCTFGLSQNGAGASRLTPLPSGKRADSALMPMYEQSAPLVGNGSNHLTSLYFPPSIALILPHRPRNQRGVNILPHRI